MMKAADNTKTHLLFIIQLNFSNISSMTIEGWEEWREIDEINYRERGDWFEVELPFSLHIDVCFHNFTPVNSSLHHAYIYYPSIHHTTPHKLPLFADLFNYDRAGEMKFYDMKIKCTYSLIL